MARSLTFIIIDRFLLNFLTQLLDSNEHKADVFWFQELPLTLWIHQTQVDADGHHDTIAASPACKQQHIPETGSRRHLAICTGVNQVQAETEHHG